MSPDPDKTRLSISCFECRSRKVKCDRGDPCSNCVERKTECRKEVLSKPNRKKRHLSTTSSHGNTSTDITAEVSNGTTGFEPYTPTSCNEGIFNNTLATFNSNSISTLNPSIPSTAPPSNTTPASSLPEFSENQMDNQMNGFDDLLFSNDFIDSLLLGSESVFHQAAASDPRVTGDFSMSSTTAQLFPSATMPLRNTMCVKRFRVEADKLSQNTLQEYHQLLPPINEISNLISTLKQRSASFSARSDTNTFLDCNHYERILRQHIAAFAMGGLDSMQSATTGKDALYIICGLYFVAAVRFKSNPDATSDNKVALMSSLANKLDRQLIGVEPSLQALQSYRMLSLANLLQNKTKESSSAILSGSRAAISMGIHKHATLATFPTNEHPYLTDVLFNLICDSCMMQAIFGIRTPIDPGSMEASLFDLGESTLESDSGCVKGSTDTSHGRTLPVRLRMHATLWIFLERYYSFQGRLELPTEQWLMAPSPLDHAESHEIGQFLSLNTILKRSSRELEKPLSPWIAMDDKETKTLSEADEIGLNKAIQTLFMIRYYRMLVVYPFVYIDIESRNSLEETARSIINSTWRIAKKAKKDNMSNLDFCRRICLRALVLLAASKCPHLAPGISIMSSKVDETTSGTERAEQAIAEFELGIDALEKIDQLLDHTKPLAGLASTLPYQPSAIVH